LTNKIRNKSIVSDATDLTGPRSRQLVVWNRSPVGLERPLSVERTMTEHVVDSRQRERADGTAPEPAAEQQLRLE